MITLRSLLFVAQVIPIVVASEEIFVNGPKVTLDNGLFTGKSVGLTHQFLAIPFAKPPFVIKWVLFGLKLTNLCSIGDLRFRLPQTIPPYVGKYDATKHGLACPQQAISIPAVMGATKAVADFITNTIYGHVFPDSEDCKSSQKAYH